VLPLLDPESLKSLDTQDPRIIMPKTIYVTHKCPKYRFQKKLSTRLKRQKPAKIDKREFLDVNIDTIKEKWPTALIFPEHKPKAITFE